MRLDLETMKISQQPLTLREPTMQPDAHRLLLECMAEGVCSLDTRGKLTFLNRAAAQMLGVDPLAVLGRSCHEVMHQSHSSASTPEECPICQTLCSPQGSLVTHEVFWRPDGTSFPVEYSARPLREGEIDYGTIITFSDVTRREIHAREMLYILASAKCLLWYADIQYVRPKQKMRWFLWPAD